MATKTKEKPIEVDHANGQAPAVIEPTPLSIIAQFANDPNFDVDKLGKLLDMQERIYRRTAEEEYNRAMAECQAEMPTVVHDAINNETRKTYARLEAIQQICKPIYSKRGFSLSFANEKSDKENFYHVFCDILHHGGHSKRYFLYNVPIDMTGPKGGANKTAIQGMVSSESYACRKLLCMVFNITVADEDKDGTTSDFITGDQVAEWNDLLTEKNVELAKFLKWAGIEGLDKMPAADHGKRMAEAKTWKKRAETPAPEPKPFAPVASRAQLDAIEIEVKIAECNLNGHFPDGTLILPEGKLSLRELTGTEADALLKALKHWNAKKWTT